MKCTCVYDVSKQIAAKMAERGAVNARVDPVFVALDLNTGGEVITLPYTVHGDNKPYNTMKGKTVSMFASFCPFCGVPTK